jgi:SH3-like domain-containing protein
MGEANKTVCPRLLGAAIAATAAILLVASAPSPEPNEQCSADFYFVDRDPSTNIRAAPSLSAKVVARVDPSTTVVHVVGSKDGWFKAVTVTDAESDKVLFRGAGWIHRSVLGLSVASGEHWLRSAPTASAKRLLKLVPDGNALAPQACLGSWVQVRVDGKATGWIDHSTICENPLTTCS